MPMRCSVIAKNDALRLAAGKAGNAKAAGYRWEAINQAVLDVYLKVMTRRGEIGIQTHC